ncbi:MAG TPA: prepilin-type N-terminal cleavage/methylation domain-containing protein [Mariniflexile sp.]|jgi:competence protein ComGF
MKNKQLKGFTILEALISLMLMGIIITVTYSLFNLIGKQLSLFEKENAEVLEYNLFNSTLMRDIDKSNDFIVDDDKLVLKNYNNNDVYYNLNGHYVLRKNAVKTDTFKVRILDYKFINNDVENPVNTTFQIALNVLNDTINAYYLLEKNNSVIINDIYFNED